MDVMEPVADQVARATLIGVTVRASEAEDRVPADTRRPGTACPTCDDGIRTITYPYRCKACVQEGL